MKIANIVPEEKYAIKMGHRIEPGVVKAFRRSQGHKGPMGVMVRLKHRKKPPYDKAIWVSAGRVLELWTEMVEGFRQEEARKDRHLTQMIAYKDLLRGALDINNLEEVDLKLSQGNLVLTITEPVDAHWLWFRLDG